MLVLVICTAISQWANMSAWMIHKHMALWHCTIRINTANIRHRYKRCYLSPGLGAAYGTAKSGTGIASMAILRPDLVIKSVIPVVMAGIIGIYGLVVAALISTNIGQKYTLGK